MSDQPIVQSTALPAQSRGSGPLGKLSFEGLAKQGAGLTKNTAEVVATAAATKIAKGPLQAALALLKLG